MKIDKKIHNRFYYIKKLINSNNDIKEFEDGFYYNSKAINYVNKLNKNFFMNSYYNLTNIDILLMIDENKSIKEVKQQLFKEYQEDYADAVYQAFVDALKLKLNTI